MVWCDVNGYMKCEHFLFFYLIIHIIQKPEQFGGTLEHQRKSVSCGIALMCF